MLKRQIREFIINKLKAFYSTESDDDITRLFTDKQMFNIIEVHQRKITL